MKVQLGCGRKPLEGFVNVDNRKLPGVDVVMDIEEDWPWLENTVDVLLCVHILEHVRDLVSFMDKAHTVLKPDGDLIVHVPHHRHRNADTDPTHVRFFTESSFDYWVPGTHYEGFSNLHWSIEEFEVIGGRRPPLLRFFWPHLKFLYLIPPTELRWRMRPIKGDFSCGS